MIHGFSFVFCFALSYQGIVPFKKNPNFILAELPLGEKREFSRPRPRTWEIRRTEELRKVKVAKACPGLLRGQAHPALLRFRNAEAVRREIKQINCVALGILELPKKILWKSIFKGFGLFFLSEERVAEMGRNPDPGILSTQLRSERACYLLETDICCCEISSTGKQDHQLLLTQPLSQAELHTVPSACARHRTRPQPRPASSPHQQDP